MMLARSALQSLDQVVDLFESLGEKTRAAKVLVSIFSHIYLSHPLANKINV